MNDMKNELKQEMQDTKTELKQVIRKLNQKFTVLGNDVIEARADIIYLQKEI